MKFSILVVCLNPGEKLKHTLESVWMQDYRDYEIIIKDGGSTDGAVEQVPGGERLRIVQREDSGIYDAMNQAVSYAQGEYLFFLNCGDKFHDPGVLGRIAQETEKVQSGEKVILYGKIFGEKHQVWITPAPQITGFTCYRNVPCHQACFYSAALCREKPFVPKYRIRGDYEHFLWCFYRGGARPVYVDTAIADYEGGGYSETKENLKRSKQEHKEITKYYMSGGERFWYQLLLWVTLAPLRRALAESRYFSGWYHKLRGWLYQRKKI